MLQRRKNLLDQSRSALLPRLVRNRTPIPSRETCIGRVLVYEGFQSCD